MAPRGPTGTLKKARRTQLRESEIWKERDNAPSKIAKIFAEGWEEIWNEPWEDALDRFGPIPLREIKSLHALTGRKLQAV
eukprot:13614985-Heterocapsa_arctica.AAC.1